MATSLGEGNSLDSKPTVLSLKIYLVSHPACGQRVG